MNWIRKTTRLAIYLRDGLACAYCGSGVEDGEQLTLDHLVPNSQGGTNAPTNLVTACRRCNTARGVRPVRTFCAAVAEYLAGRADAPDASTIERHVRNCARRTLDRKAAKDLIERRGWAAAQKKA